jgi:hypothetical protein
MRRSVRAEPEEDGAGRECAEGEIKEEERGAGDERERDARKRGRAELLLEPRRARLLLQAHAAKRNKVTWQSEADLDGGEDEDVALAQRPSDRSGEADENAQEEREHVLLLDAVRSRSAKGGR